MHGSLEKGKKPKVRVEAGKLGSMAAGWRVYDGDTISPAERSAVMARIRSKGTKPEKRAPLA